MSIFDRIFRREAKRERRMTDAELIAALGGPLSASGAPVTTETALTFSAVLACVLVLSESVASLPLITYRRLPDGSRIRVLEHPVYSLLHDAPNDEMTAMQWRQTCMAHLCLWGNSYSEIVRDG